MIARRSAPAPELDAFFAAFRIPDLIFQLVAAGALSSALVPVVAGAPRDRRAIPRLARGLDRGQPDARRAARPRAIVFVSAPSPRADLSPRVRARAMARTDRADADHAARPILLALGALATSVLNARGRFAASAIAPIVYNLAIIGAALLLAPTFGVRAGGRRRPRVARPPPGPAPRRSGRSASATSRGSTRRTRRAQGARADGAAGRGLGAGQITFVVVTSLATTIGVGAVTAFTIAFTLLQIPIGVIGVPLGVVLFPSLSRGAASGDQSSSSAC